MKAAVWVEAVIRAIVVCMIIRLDLRFTIYDLRTAWVVAIYLAAALIAFGSASSSSPEPEKPSVIVVVGAAGEEEFGKQFTQWADRWQEAAQAASARLVRIGNNPADNETDLDRVR